MPKFARITSEVINRLRKNSAMRNALPFLKHPPKKKPSKKRTGCGGCGAVKRTPPVLDHNAIKRRISQLPPQQLKLVKTHLDANELRIRFRDSRNRVVDKTR